MIIKDIKSKNFMVVYINKKYDEQGSKCMKEKKRKLCIVDVSCLDYLVYMVECLCVGWY